jgi:hypothetical protein
MSIPSCITLRTVKGSVLSWAELDNNFVCLNNLINSKSGTGGNQFHIPSGDTVTVFTDYQYFFYGDIFIEGTLELMAGSQLVVLNGDIITGGTGTITGTGDIYNIDLPEFDTKVTGMTYSGNVITVYQNDGSTYSSVITTTDIRVSGLTYSGNVLTLSQTDGSEFNVTIPQFTGNTSGDCITDIYVSNVNSCSPLHIQPNSNGNVLIGENGGVNVGIGTTTPNAKLGIKGIGSTLSTYGIKIQNSGGTDNFVVRDDGATFVGSNLLFYQDKIGINDFNPISNISINSQNGITYPLSISSVNVGLTRSRFLNAGGNQTDIQIGNNNGGNSIYLGLTNTSIPYLDNRTNNNFEYRIVGTPKVTIDTTGNVGIGTSSPSERLEVNGKTKTTNLQVTSGSTEGYILTALDNQGNVGWLPFNNDNITELAPVISIVSTPITGSTDGDRYLISGGTGIWSGKTNYITEWLNPNWVYTSGTTDNTVFVTDTLTTYRYNGTNWTPYRGTAILQNGNKLNTSINIGSNDNQDVNFRTSGTTKMTITKGGNVGIGISTPSSDFNILGSPLNSNNFVLTQPLTFGTLNITAGTPTYITNTVVTGVGVNFNNFLNVGEIITVKGKVAPNYTATTNINLTISSIPNNTTLITNFDVRFSGTPDWAVTGLTYTTQSLTRLIANSRGNLIVNSNTLTTTNGINDTLIVRGINSTSSGSTINAINYAGSQLFNVRNDGYIGLGSNKTPIQNTGYPWGYPISDVSGYTLTNYVPKAQINGVLNIVGNNSILFGNVHTSAIGKVTGAGVYGFGLYGGFHSYSYPLGNGGFSYTYPNSHPLSGTTIYPPGMTTYPNPSYPTFSGSGKDVLVDIAYTTVFPNNTYSSVVGSNLFPNGYKNRDGNNTSNLLLEGANVIMHIEGGYCNGTGKFAVVTNHCGNNHSEKFSISEGGNIRIGATENTDSRLSVGNYRNIGAGSHHLIKAQSMYGNGFNWGESFIVNTYGYVGIGTFSPTALVHIKGPYENPWWTPKTGTTINGGTSGYQPYTLKIDGNTGNPFLHITDLGNIGVATTSPSEKLEVVGKTKTTNFQMTSGATTGYILTSTDSNGNGKWSPISGITGIGTVTKYTTNLTFTDSETKTITHNLNTKFVHCSVWDTSTNELITPQLVRVTGSETTSLYITISTGGNYDILITG